MFDTNIYDKIALEELIAFGVKRFISIGTAGTLQKDIKVGDLIVCEKAIRDEGTSYHYLKPSKYAYASKEMTKRIKNALDALEQKYFVGTSWTIDAPYRETVVEARQYQKEGVATVEMKLRRYLPLQSIEAQKWEQCLLLAILWQNCNGCQSSISKKHEVG